MSELRPFPKYMNHVDHDEPVRVDSKAEQVDMQNKGWTTARIFKEYPKWVAGKLVYSGAEETRLLISQTRPADPADTDIPDLSEFPTMDPESVDPALVPKDFKTGKDTQGRGQDTATVEKAKKSVGRPKNL